MAERVIDLVIENSPRRRSTINCYTHKIRLGDGKLTNTRSVKRYVNAVRKQVVALGLGRELASYLVENYGKQSDRILKQLSRFDSDDAELALIKSELHFAIEKEMTCSSVDFFMRRTGRLYFDIKSVFKYQNKVNAELAYVLGWDDQQKVKDRDLLHQEINKSLGFRQ